MFSLRSSSNSNKKQPIEVDGNGKGATSNKGETEQEEDDQVKNLYNENPLANVESYMDYVQQETQVYPISRTTTPHQINIGSMESVHEDDGTFNPIAQSSTLLSHDEDELAKDINENDDENEEGVMRRQTRNVNRNEYPLSGEQRGEEDIMFDSGGVRESGINEKRQNSPRDEAMQGVCAPQDDSVHMENNVSYGNGESESGQQFDPNCEKEEPAEGKEIEADVEVDEDKMGKLPLEQNNRVEGVSVGSHVEESRLHNELVPTFNEGKPNDGEPNPDENSLNALQHRNEMCKNEESKEKFDESLISESCVYNEDEQVKSENQLDGKLNVDMQRKNENSEGNSNEHFKNSLVKDMLMQKESGTEHPSPIDQNKTLSLIDNLLSIKGEEGVKNQCGKLFPEDRRDPVSNAYGSVPIVNESIAGGNPCGGAHVAGGIPAHVHGGGVDPVAGVGKSAYMSHRETPINECVGNGAVRNNLVGSNPVGSNHVGGNLVGSNLVGGAPFGSTPFGSLPSGGIYEGYAMASKEAQNKSENIRKSKIMCLSYLRILKRLTSIWSETNKSFEYHFVNILNNVEMNNLDVYLCCFSNIRISAAKSLFLDSIVECMDELEIIKKLKSVQGKEENNLYDKSTSFSSSSSSGNNKNGKSEMLKQIMDEVESNLSKDIVDEMHDLSLRNPYVSSTYHGNNSVSNVMPAGPPHVEDGEPSVLSLYSCANRKGSGNHNVCNDSSGNVDLKRGKDFQTCGGRSQCGVSGACSGGAASAGGGSFPSYACNSHGNHFACPSGHMHSNCLGNNGNNKVNPLSNNYSANMMGVAGNNPLSYSNSFGSASNSCKKKCSYSDENILNKLNVSIDYNSYNDYSNNYIQEAEKVVEKYKNLSKLNSKESENMYSTCSQSSVNDVGNANVNAYLHFKSFLAEYANMQKGGGAEKNKLKDGDLTSSDLSFLRCLCAHLCGSGRWEDNGPNHVFSHEKDVNKFLQEYKLSDEDNFDEREYYTKYGRSGNKGGILSGCDGNANFSSNSFQSIMRKRKLRDTSGAHHHQNYHSMQKCSGTSVGGAVGNASGVTDLGGNSTGVGSYDLNYLLSNTNLLKKLKFNLLEEKKGGVGNVNGVVGEGSLPGSSGNSLLGVIDFLKKDSNDYSVEENGGPHMNTRRSVANKNNMKNYKDMLNLSQEILGKKGTNGGASAAAAGSSSPYKNGNGRDRERERDSDIFQHQNYPLHHPSLRHHHINPSALYDFIMNTNTSSSGYMENSLRHPGSLLMNSQNGNHGNDSNLRENGSGHHNNSIGNNNNGTSTTTANGLQKKSSYDFSADYNSKMSANESELSLSNNDNSSELLLGSGKMEGGSSVAAGLGSGISAGGVHGGMSPYKHSKNENGKTVGMNTPNGGSKNMKNLKSSSTIAPVQATNYGMGKLKYEMPVGVNPNDDKVKGVYFSKSPRGVGKWNAYFQIANNKRLFTSFSVSKYGYNEARKLSILKRTEWEKEYRHHTDLKNAEVKKGKKKSNNYHHQQEQAQQQPQRHHDVNGNLVKNNVKGLPKGNNNHSINSNSEESISYGKENKLNEDSSLMYSNDDEEGCLISDKLAADISSELNDLGDLNHLNGLNGLNNLNGFDDSHVLSGGGGKKVNKLSMSSGNNGNSGGGGNVATAGVGVGEGNNLDDNMDFFIECTKDDNDVFNSMDLLRSSLNGVAPDDSNNNNDGKGPSRRSALNGSGKFPSNSLVDSYGSGAENNNTMNNSNNRNHSNNSKESVNSSRVLSNSIGLPNKYIRNLQFPAIDSHTVSNFLEAVTDDQKISS
ncbi:Uncharacterized protein PCOAH_00023990 [Plasmodium coatneyi]|uniref:Uncharacterized protein n=1 Tax=Plasmodium coatneyi TaxID=208452 RepID=A0A1B1DYX8_9APIC|nr:Uncharacterized protein PCOAH_00023990 [Plasmodium coatneyi]ANQ08011.1 Uncharacterized protein PCOAH_00023990 [Plasmodium coatneyi]